jgi:hypothetical protein
VKASSARSGSPRFRCRIPIESHFSRRL